MKSNEARSASRLVEVWGDTADTGHLAWSILIGGSVSIVSFLVASRLLAGLVATPELARAYAMLAGLAGCLLAGVICAILFRPKREVTEGDAGDPRWREEVLDKLAAESGGLGSVADLPAAAVREMQELQLFELFASREGHSPAIVPGASAASPAAPVQPQSTAT